MDGCFLQEDKSGGTVDRTTTLSEDDLEKLGPLTLAALGTEQGREIFSVLAPNKDNLPGKLRNQETVVTDETEAFQLINYLKEHTDISVVWPYEADEAKQIVVRGFTANWIRRGNRSLYRCKSAGRGVGSGNAGAFGSVCRAIGDFPWRSCKYVKCPAFEWG